MSKSSWPREIKTNLGAVLERLQAHPRLSQHLDTWSFQAIKPPPLLYPDFNQKRGFFNCTGGRHNQEQCIRLNDSPYQSAVLLSPRELLKKHHPAIPELRLRHETTTGGNQASERPQKSCVEQKPRGSSLPPLTKGSNWEHKPGTDLQHCAGLSRTGLVSEVP